MSRGRPLHSPRQRALQYPLLTPMMPLWRRGTVDHPRMLPQTHRATGLHRIVIVGGGAGGLELATRLGDKLGHRRKADITLIDKARTHLWKRSEEDTSELQPPI